MLPWVAGFVGRFVAAVAAGVDVACVGAAVVRSARLAVGDASTDGVRVTGAVLARRCILLRCAAGVGRLDVPLAAGSGENAGCGPADIAVARSAP
jgi:hypothetical protein